jgi:death on curing protein
MITKEIILQLHEFSIRKYGGGAGIRDVEGMESAIARPYQTFGGEELYPDPYSKAAAIGESIIVNHPFVDGNKRTGFLAMLAILESEGLEITVSNEQIYSFVINISTGSFRFDEILQWLKANTRPL